MSDRTLASKDIPMLFPGGGSGSSIMWLLELLIFPVIDGGRFEALIGVLCLLNAALLLLFILKLEEPVPYACLSNVAYLSSYYFEIKSWAPCSVYYALKFANYVA